MKRKIAAILAADIVGYSRLVAEDEEDTLSRLDSYRRVYEDFVTRAGGRIFNTAGDSVLAEFSSAVEATRCAIDIQESIRTRNLGYPPSRQMLFRMGLTIGDVVEREGDLLGDGVNIAARLEGLASPGGICVSQSVFEQVANKLSVPFRDLGEQEVKNIPQPVHAFMVDLRGEGVHPKGGPARPASANSQYARNRKAGYALAAGALALIVGLGALATVLWREFRPLPPAPVQPRIVKVEPPAGVKPAGSPERSKALEQGKAATPQTSAKPQTADSATGAKTASEADAKRAETAGQQGQQNVAEKQPPESKSANIKAAPKQAEKTTSQAQGKSASRYPAGATAAQIFSMLAKNGGIVNDPTTVAELYHNARLWEARGQSANARMSYARLVRMGVEAIDAHMRYAAILRAQDGRAGAREIYSALENKGGGRVAALVHAMQFSGAGRRERIAAFAAKHLDYAPAHMLIAREYSAGSLGTQTLADKRRQREALKLFLKAEDDGALPKYFIDHSVLTAWVDEARRTYARLDAYFRTATLKPVASYMRSNQSWMVNISLPEAATEISYRTGKTGAFRPTGSFPHIDQRTGKPMANPSIELPADTQTTDIAIRYKDANNADQGPFELHFDPRKALISSQRDLLERFSTSWLVFGENHQNNLLYFTHLLSYRCAIARAVIGFNDGPLDRDLPIPTCDMRNPHAIPGNSRIFLRVSADVRKVRIQLTYADGSKSEEKSFRR